MPRRSLSLQLLWLVVVLVTGCVVGVMWVMYALWRASMWSTQQ